MQAHLFTIDTALITARVVTRRLRENEGEVLYNFLMDNTGAVAEHFPGWFDDMFDKETAEVWLRQSIIDWLLQKNYVFGVWENKSAHLIGLLTFSGIDWKMGRAELNFLLDRAYTGKGFMTEVMLACLRFAFQQLKLEKLYIRTAMDNHPVQRLARKCGFRREGDLRADLRKPAGEIQDAMLLGLAKAEYGSGG